MSKWTDCWGDPHFVYRCYDEAGDLLYIGCTVNPRRRMRQHRTKSPWFSKVTRIEYDEFPDNYAGIEAESRAIAAEKPRWNRQFIKQYAQADGGAA